MSKKGEYRRSSIQYPLLFLDEMADHKTQDHPKETIGVSLVDAILWAWRITRCRGGSAAETLPHRLHGLKRRLLRLVHPQPPQKAEDRLVAALVLCDLVHAASCQVVQQQVLQRAQHRCAPEGVLHASSCQRSPSSRKRARRFVESSAMSAHSPTSSRVTSSTTSTLASAPPGSGRHLQLAVQQQQFMQNSDIIYATMDDATTAEMGCLGASPVGTPSQGAQVFRVATRVQASPMQKDVERDVFARQTNGCRVPTIDFSSWKDRISEALGFLTWMEKLTSWVGLGSEVFPNELMHAVKTHDETRLQQDQLTVEQQKRSTQRWKGFKWKFDGIQ
ncbi:unnamed protein product [Symbiodinium natans]|uniref:Uncharacterized protein n=1 Tax=Symbiodinium natans TaxID=878477 RepID=A0A812ICR4_9DINO|nr:unnamed protein product [Symbiodinium natans]